MLFHFLPKGKSSRNCKESWEGENWRQITSPEVIQAKLVGGTGVPRGHDNETSSFLLPPSHFLPASP